MAKHKSHASSCHKYNFETKNEGKLTNHVAKHRSQESSEDKSKTSANITSNLKENVATSFCNKCELKAPSAPFFNVSDVEDELAEVKDDNHDVTLARDDGKRGGGLL